MRRIEIYIEDELDEVLEAEATRTGSSKAALIRECVEDKYDAPGSAETDPLTALVGAFDAEPADIDEVVYGR